MNEIVGWSPGWRKSVHSLSGECVEVSEYSQRAIAVRDSKNMSGLNLIIATNAWREFVGRVKCELLLCNSSTRCRRNGVPTGPTASPTMRPRQAAGTAWCRPSATSRRSGRFPSPELRKRVNSPPKLRCPDQASRRYRYSFPPGLTAAAAGVILPGCRRRRGRAGFAAARPCRTRRRRWLR